MVRGRRPAVAGSADGLVRPVALADLRPTPENDLLYGPIDPRDADFRDLVKSVKADGVTDPLEATVDGWIVSGHRRYAAARAAGLATVPVIVNPDLSGRPDLRTLASRNKQRVKTDAQKMREAIAETNPDDAYRSLREYREAASHVDVDAMEIRGTKRRKTISDVKAGMLAAVVRVVEGMQTFWPLTVRQVHYRLLNDPPLRNAGEPSSTYANTKQSYKDLCDLMARARLAGEIRWCSVADETRPQRVWSTWGDTGAFLRRELDQLFKGFWRDVMRGQPNHIEIVGEKNTIQGVIEPVAREYTIPLTIGRGYCSLQPRYEMAQRFKRAGKAKLIILALSDHDPDGEEIAESFARSMRDDFDVDQIHPVRVALTADQIQKYKLPPIMTAKEGSAHHDKFVERHGHDVFELEAIPPADLQQILRDAINSVLDVDAYNREVDREKQDAAFLEAARRRACDALQGMSWESEGSGTAG